MAQASALQARNAEIYRRYAVDKVEQRRLARDYGLAQGRISEIVGTERRRRDAAGLPPLEDREVVVPPPPPLPSRGPRARLVPTRVIEWGGAFGPDVEHADAAVAEADRRPLWGGRYPKSPRHVHSPMGSPAAACAEEAGR